VAAVELRKELNLVLLAQDNCEKSQLWWLASSACRQPTDSTQKWSFTVSISCR
jgi:hypothetical protein